MNSTKYKRQRYKRLLWIPCIIAPLAVLLWLLLASSITDEQKLGKTVSDKLFTKAQTAGKPVIVLLFDSLMDKTLQLAIEEGKAPAFSFLMKHGDYYPNIVSSYPTMSVTIDSSLLTGSYADQHHVPGLIWFDQQHNQIISYGSGPHEIYENNIKNVLQHSIIDLNQSHLSHEVSTLYEELAQLQIEAASINGLVYRGNTSHELHVPNLFSQLDLLPKNITAYGPNFLSLGVLSQYNKANDQHNYAWDRYGFNNQFTINELSLLISQNLLPSFTLAYLPDADASLHKHGPHDTDAIEHADQSLQQLLNLFGSWENALKEVIWIVLGDSGQSAVGNDKQLSLLNINELLAGYSLWSTKNPEGQLALALNERMGYIHILDHNLSIDELIAKFKQDKRIGFIAWKEQATINVVSPHYSGTLRFASQGKYTDRYHQSWTLEGELQILGLRLNDQNQVEYSHYPDALARIQGALTAQQGKFLIVDLMPSYELQDRISYNHVGGGSHGSLYKEDSLTPLIAVGTDNKLQDERIVALKQWLINIVRTQAELNLPSK